MYHNLETSALKESSKHCTKRFNLTYWLIMIKLIVWHEIFVIIKMNEAPIFCKLPTLHQL